MTFQSLCAELDAQYLAGERESMFVTIRRLALLRLCGNEDAAQDAAIKVLLGLSDYVPKTEFSRWVNAIITRAKHDAGRAAKIDQRQQQLTAADEAAGNSEYRFPDTESIDDEFIKVVADLMLQGFSIEEIARMAEMKPMAIYQRVHRYKNGIKVPEIQNNAI